MYFANANLLCSLLKRFNQKRPSWVDRREFLDPSLQNLFDLSYFSEMDTLIPTGWQSVQEDNMLPRLSSRQPKVAASDVEMRSPGPLEGSDESGSEESGRIPASVVTRMAEESSEEDSDFPKKVRSSLMTGRHSDGLREPVLPDCHIQNLQPRFQNQVSARGRKKGKAVRTYGKKGKKRFEKQQRGARFQQPMVGSPVDSEESLPGGALIGLGEGIVVEWSEAAFDVVFGGSSTDDSRGSKTWLKVPKLADPSVEARQKQRLLRKKHGIALDDCLDEFEKEEILSEQDTWYCPRCKEHRRASKKFDLWKTPDILVVHLKRFSSSGWRRDKLEILVDFPIEGLDLTKRVIDQESGKQEIYDLIAVDDHWGGLGGGHYTAFAKNWVDGEWYEYNGECPFHPRSYTSCMFLES
jgi:ubiquitin carboxyl-terminal hydrolase 4/11/15